MSKQINLPHDDSSCGWYAALPQQPACKRLHGEQRADYAVIGAGFAGLAAARRLGELLPDKRIIQVDAQRVGQGASGRNSGFVIDLPHKFALEHPDPAHKQRLLSLNRAAIAQLQGLIERHGIDCQWSHAGKYQGAVGQRGLAYLQHFEQLLKNLGEPFRLVERDELAQVLGNAYYSRAIFTPGCYLMQPAALVTGLAHSLPENVELLEESPITGLQRDGHGGWLLQGSQGTIRTEQLLLGTSIFTQEFGYLRNRLLPVMTFASWTRPLSDAELAAYGGQLDWGLTPADHAGTTVRMTQDRRLIIRNTYKHVPKYGKSTSDGMRESVRADHRKAFLARFPQLADVPFSHTWGGVYAISRNFTNFFGELEPGVFASACDNGVGAAWGTISGTLLAEMAVGSDSAQLRDIQAVTGMPSLNPPEPFLGLGVRSRIRLAAWNSRSEL
ncbi:FAD-binding oxidoreductase [Pseudomonas chengduensis]|jgi:glycine/D-amino acid oxidase-like deaminating enzyme|uniref:Glycine/D-amino acid oxidase n=1 Tax=Ectopseudomonas chengduensis TaxID=489632 RepID=A0A1G6V1Y9_9GAMM|nr:MULTISPECIES: FAD-dependent oxidoreductase [Pseudomonas]KQO31023.1 oxidoreductase [Pseudomonas sp. Leaf83]MBP3063907.1 FAD-dependent oxidoreductase [Pseudomonas chengduensis]MDH0959208.1 FAD-binding oxidoreductase [Pseudomonas chengduensis]MDH1536186.1 FAD-binding oxidoreductase [Pseudomonas chengduensis]NNB76909.1 FAD-binding oxidoreductase [Pseudomonas chengduensis]